MLPGRTLISFVTVGAALALPTPASAGLTLVESGATSTGSSAQGVAEASCPGGSEIAGGGAYTSGGYLDTAINSSYPSSDTVWREYTDVYIGSATHYAYAICDTANVTRKDETQNIAAEKTKTIKVDCPGGKNVYGGGFYSAGGYGATDALVSKPSGDGWQVKLHNFRDDSAVAASSYVLCGPANSKVVTRTNKLEGDDQSSAVVACPGDDRLSGGGAALSSKTASTWISTLYPETKRKWKVYGENGTGTDYKITSYAICR